MPSIESEEITRLLKAEREQATLAAVVENSPDAIILENLDGTITSWNPGAERLFGYSAAEAIGRHISIVAPPDNPSDVLDVVNSARNGQIVRRIAAERVRKDGKRVIISLAVSPIRAPDGRIIGIAKMAHDITELRQSRQRLERNNQRLAIHNAAAELLLLAENPSRALSSVFERMAEYFQIDGFIEFDLAPSTKELKLAACNAFGEQRHSDVSRICLGQGVAGKVAQTRQPMVFENVQNSDDPDLQNLRELGIHAYACEPLVVGDQLLGTLSFASARRDRFEAEDQEFFRTLANYVSLAKERLRLIHELQQHANSLEGIVRERTAQLVEVNTSLQTFAYNAAHDLRSPLRSIKSFADIILRDQAHLPEPTQALLGRIVESADQLNALVGDLLEYSKLSKAEFPLETVQLDRAVEQAVGLVDEEIRTSNAEVSIHRPLSPILGNSASVALVITNLLTNAIKFSAKGVQPKVRIWTENCRSFVRLWVQDKGIGIQEADQEKLFEPFQRLNSRSAYPGTGLGLAIVRRAVERMGGRVGVESSPAGGSRFWVELRPAL